MIGPGIPFIESRAKENIKSSGFFHKDHTCKQDGAMETFLFCVLVSG